MGLDSKHLWLDSAIHQPLVIGPGLGFDAIGGCDTLECDLLGDLFSIMYRGCATLSVVAGFVSMLPGGAGVRELVVTLVLAPTIGSAPALAVAVWMRLVSLAAEILWIGCTRVSELAKGSRLS